MKLAVALVLGLVMDAHADGEAPAAAPAEVTSRFSDAPLQLQVAATGQLPYHPAFFAGLGIRVGVRSPSASGWFASAGATLAERMIGSLEGEPSVEKTAFALAGLRKGVEHGVLRAQIGLGLGAAVTSTEVGMQDPQARSVAGVFLAPGASASLALRRRVALAVEAEYQKAFLGHELDTFALTIGAIIGL